MPPETAKIIAGATEDPTAVQAWRIKNHDRHTNGSTTETMETPK